MRMIKVVTQVKRLGTVGILRLTEGMDAKKKYDIIAYISQLEQSENRLAGQIQNFYNAVSHYEDDH